MTLENIQFIISVCTLVGFVFIIYKTFTDPDVKSAKKIEVMEGQCELKHLRLDEITTELKNAILLIKENHLPHIEKDVRAISMAQTEILTILKERNLK